MRALIILVISLVVLTDITIAKRIVGGDVVRSISQYPFMTSLLGAQTGFTFSLRCGGSIINERSVLTAAHCFGRLPFAFQWRIRAGSLYHDRDGVVSSINIIILHPNYNAQIIDNDIAIMRINGAFSFSNELRAAYLARYSPVHDSPVWAVGWGALYYEGPGSDELRHVQKFVINQDICRSRYAENGNIITDNMLCSGVLDVGGRDACQGDSGGPLIYNNVIVGITSFGINCAHPYFPGVNVRVWQFIPWIQNNL